MILKHGGQVEFLRVDIRNTHTPDIQSMMHDVYAYS